MWTLVRAWERREKSPKKNLDAAVMLKMEYLIELTDVGISMPCFRVASTPSLVSPFPEISFSWSMMQSVIACLEKIFFSGNENVEKSKV